MFKKIKVPMLFLVAVGLILGTVFSQRTEAIVSGVNSLVSYDSTNTLPVGGDYAVPSDDGNFVAFVSRNSNIVPGDVNGSDDLFLRNVKTNTTTLVNQSTSGVMTTVGVNRMYGSFFSISKTGRYILFTSSDAHLIDGQTISNGYMHAYLRDTVLGTTTLVDKTSAGVLGSGDASSGGVSDDGRYVVFLSQASNLGGGGSSGSSRLYMRDMLNNTLQVLSRSVGGVNANASIGQMSLSCDGSFITFSSSATNLTPANNGYVSTYLVDLRNGFSITNLTLSANNITYPNSTSCDGRYIALTSKATNLTADSVSGTVNHLFRYDRISGGYDLLDKSNSGTIPSSGAADYAAEGRIVSDSGSALVGSYSTNLISPAATYTYEVYLRTPELNTTELVAINSLGQEGSPGYTSGIPHVMAITADGRGIIHTSKATNLIPGITTVGGGGNGNVVLSRVQ